MNKRHLEWIKQADYDLDTAEFMAGGKRYFYAVFMCHLSLEKALKGLYQQKLNQIPPKTHNLIYLLNEIGIKPNEDIGQFITKLNEANIPTRYPESIDRLQDIYTQVVTEQIIDRTRDILKWIKKQF